MTNLHNIKIINTIEIISIANLSCTITGYRREQLMKRDKESASFDRRGFIKTAAAGLSASAIGIPAVLTNSVKPAYAAPQKDLPKRELGKTGMKLTVLSMGSHVNPENMRNPEARIKQLKDAQERGINLFDVYEHTYKQFDNTSKALSGVRKDVHISLAWVAPEGHEGEITAKIVRQVVENSLRTFNTDYIDMYRVVNAHSEVHRDEMTKLKEEGKIRAIGYAAHYENEFIDAMKFYNLDYVLIPFNPIMNKMKYRALFPMLKEKNIGIVGIKPFASGSLFKLKENSPMLKNVEFKQGVSMAQSILKYIINQEEVVATIPAMNTVEETAENLGVLDNLAMGWMDLDIYEEARRTADKMGPSYLPPHYRWLHTEWRA